MTIDDGHEHDWGKPPIKDTAVCLTCGVPVMSGNLLDLNWDEDAPPLRET